MTLIREKDFVDSIADALGRVLEEVAGELNLG